MRASTPTLNQTPINLAGNRSGVADPIRGRQLLEFTRRVLAPVNKLPIFLAGNIRHLLSTRAAKQPTDTARISLTYPPIIIPPKATALETAVVTAPRVTVLTRFMAVIDSQGSSTTTLPPREVPFVLHVATGQVLAYVSCAQFSLGGGRS